MALQGPSRRTVLRGAAVAPAAVLVAGCDSTSGKSPGGGQATHSPSPTQSATSPSVTAGASSSPSTSSSAADLSRRPGAARTLTSGIEVPWSFAFLPTGDALVSSRDTGLVLRLTPQGHQHVVGTVPDVVSTKDQGGEGGLLGLALHPQFPSEPWLYAYHTAAQDNRVVRMRYRGGRLGRPQLVLDGIATSLHHNGGGLTFGPDGHLFVSTGDAEDTSHPQDKRSLNGKILRITDTGRTPSGNPFGNPVWTYGHRNVEGLAFDEQGQLWASEFGNKAEDELNEIVRGGDYGWPAVEGPDGPGGYRDPLASWPTYACSPSGIAIRYGRAWLGALQGRCVYSVVLRGRHAGRIERHLTGHGRIRAVVAAPDGSLWVGTSNRDGRATPRAGDDHVLRLPFG